MNKKLFFGLFAATSMLFATSCSNDELDVVQSGNEVQVSFSLGLEDGIDSRAISDGKTADKLMYAVFDEDGARISGIDKVEKETTFPATETITLAKGQTYQVAFWAQNKACEAYTVSDDMKVTIDYTKSNSNNNETRDAFFKTVEFTVTGSTSIDVELERPFAQINVGVAETDWNAAVESGITILNSSAVIKKAATNLDLLTGTVSGSADVSYTLSQIPAQFTTPETLEVDTDGDGIKEEYKWLSMSYILPADVTTGYASTTLDEVAFEFAPETGKGNPIKFDQGLNSVPVQRNYRTNILGKILTGDIQFNISIDPIYNEEDINYPNGSAQELELAAKFGGAVTLTEDVVLTEALIVEKDMILNLNGKTITTPNSIYVQGQASALITVKNGTLIIKGEGTINGAGSDDYAVEVRGGNLVIEGGKYIGAATAVYALKGNITIKGGEFSQEGYENDNYVINLYNNGNNNEASISVMGGVFKNFNPAANAAENPAKSFVAEGYVASANADGTYTVTPGVVLNDVADLSNALNNAVAGSTIVLPANVTEPIQVGEMKDVVIDAADNAKVRFVTDANSKVENVTIKNIAFEFTTGTGQKGGACVVIDASAKIENLVIENSTFVGDGKKNSYGIFGKNENATITVKNCSFSNLGYAIQATSGGGYESLTVEGCSFDNINSWVIMPQYGYSGDLTITGCTFNGCSDGLVKTGAFSGSTFTFTNNTITNSAGHDGKDSKWFEVNASTATKVISDNTKDGSAWTPGTADGLK